MFAMIGCLFLITACDEEEKKKETLGSITFWVAEDFGNIEITLRSSTSGMNEVNLNGNISSHVTSGTPSCGQDNANGVFTFSGLQTNLNGFSCSYSYTATNEEGTWEDMVILSDNINCITIKLTR